MVDEPKPKAPAGWYKHPSMVDTQRYWDGEAWTDKIAPGLPAPKTAKASAPAQPQRSCAYCQTLINKNAHRCPACGGDFKHCSRCGSLQGMTSHQKFVGIVRGGTKTQYRCMTCTKTLDGPRF